MFLTDLIKLGRIEEETEPRGDHRPDLADPAADSYPLVLEILRSAEQAEDRDQLFDEITGILARSLDADLTGVIEYLPDTEGAVVKAGVGWDRDALSASRVDAGPGTAVERVLASSVPVMLKKEGSGGFEPPAMLGGHGCASGVAMRIGSAERPFGFLGAFTLTEREFTTSEVSIVEAAATAISLALDRLRLQRRFSARSGMIDLFASSVPLSQASSKLLELLGCGIGWDVATLWLVDERENLLRCVDVWHTPDIDREFIEKTYELKHRRGEGVPGLVWETGEPAWFTDLPHETRFLRARAAGKAGLKSALLFPITARGHTAGIFEIFTKNVEQPDEQLLSELATFGAQIGQLLERELISLDLARSSEEQRVVLNNLATAVAAINPDGSLRFANDAAARTVGFQTAKELLDAPLSKLRDRFRVFDERGLELEGEDRDPFRRAAAGERIGPRLVRLLDTTKGSQRWYQLRASPTFDDAGEVAWALITVDDVTKLKRNEQRLRRSEAAYRRIGEVVQRGLLPPAMPEIPSIELAVRFRALGDRTLLGGDFYDAFALPGDRWMIVVGDITGKGVEAAAFTALVRYTIRAVAVRDQDPAAALRQLNEILIEDPSQPRLCTAVCALIDTGPPSRVTLARGGHPPALHLAAGESDPRRLIPEGPVLGAFADTEFATESLELGFDDTLVLYTDGVSDAGVRTNAGPLEIEGIEASLLGTRDGGAEAIADAIDTAAGLADHGRQHDDALVVVIRGR